MECINRYMNFAIPRCEYEAIPQSLHKQIDSESLAWCGGASVWRCERVGNLHLRLQEVSQQQTFKGA